METSEAVSGTRPASVTRERRKCRPFSFRPEICGKRVRARTEYVVRERSELLPAIGIERYCDVGHVTPQVHLLRQSVFVAQRLPEQSDLAVDVVGIVDRGLRVPRAGTG